MSTHDTPDLHDVTARNRALFNHIARSSWRTEKKFWNFGDSEYGPRINAPHMTQTENISQFLLANAAKGQPWTEFKAGNQGVVLGIMEDVGLLEYKRAPETGKIVRDENGSIFCMPTQALIDRASKYLAVTEGLEFEGA
jgi:hypothetical protein